MGKLALEVPPKADVDEGKAIMPSNNALLPQASHCRAEAALAKFKRPYDGE